MRTWFLTLLELQSRFEDKPLKFQVICIQLSPKRDCSAKRVHECFRFVIAWDYFEYVSCEFDRWSGWCLNLWAAWDWRTEIRKRCFLSFSPFRLFPPVSSPNNCYRSNTNKQQHPYRHQQLQHQLVSQQLLPPQQIPTSNNTHTDTSNTNTTNRSQHHRWKQRQQHSTA